MDLTAWELRFVKTENLERLARALKVVPAPMRDPSAYHRCLRRDVADAIYRDKMKAAAEARIEMNRKAAKKLAAELADALGETGRPGQAPRARVEAQIARMQAAIDDDGWWLRTTANVALACHELRPFMRADGEARTPGGAFFEHARKQARELVATGDMPRKTFYAAFCWREPAPPKPKPARPAKAKQPPAPAPRKARDKAPTVEVYTTIRRTR